MKLKGIELKGTYKVKFSDKWFEVYNEKDNLIYGENSDGDWVKNEHDANGKRIYLENSNGYWSKSEYDEKGNPVYYENSDGIWHKIEYDEKGNLIYFENSGGYIDDKRPKELSIEEIEELLGYKIKIKGERK